MAIHFNPQPHGVTWTHYRVIQESSAGFDAETVYSMRADYTSRFARERTTTTNVQTFVGLTPHQSWVVRTARTPRLLRHERLHYVIATLIARELDHELGALTAENDAALQAAASNLIERKTSRAMDIGAAYDADTNHGRNQGQQTLWDARVHRWEHNHFRVGWP